jgi:hypothetical protein
VERKIKNIKGWRKISNAGGYINEHTGQTLIIIKKQFSSDYHVLIFVGQQTDKEDGRKISPDFPTEAKAEKSAFNFMEKHPDGTA